MANGPMRIMSETYDVYNPADGSVLGEVPKNGKVETTRAIDAAEQLFLLVVQDSQRRSTVLKRWYDLIMENQQDLATIITAEMGKPMAEALDEIAYGASFIEWFAEDQSAFMERLYRHPP